MKDSVKDIDQIKHNDNENFQRNFSRQEHSFTTAPSSNASKYDKYGMMNNLNKEKKTFK